MKDLKMKLSLIKPCIEDNKLVMGEILLNPGKISYETNDFIKFEALCKIFKKKKYNFQNLKCSKKLGVATFKLSDKKVIITKIGRITVQRAKDEKDLLETLRYIIDLLAEYDLTANKMKLV